MADFVDKIVWFIDKQIIVFGQLWEEIVSKNNLV